VSAHASGAQSDRSIAAPADEPDYRLIELMFFGYRDFVAEADRILESYGFGRAHHRVLHFVNRNPGLTVARLLDILGITKQALARVLKDLIEGGLIEQLSGDTDRRPTLLRRRHAAFAGRLRLPARHIVRRLKPISWAWSKRMSAPLSPRWRARPAKDCARCRHARSRTVPPIS
jgi:MarR family